MLPQGRLRSMNIRIRFIILVVAGVLIGTLAPALMVRAQGVFAHGAVVALQGTPHLWIADEWGGAALGWRYAGFGR